MANKSHEKHENLSNSQIVLTSLCAGAIAGALAKSSIAPLDRTKINFQISDKAYSTKKALKFLLQTYKEKGLFALWRGNSATMMRIVPYAAIQFTAHEQWKKILGIDPAHLDPSPSKLLLAGSLAGVTSQTLTYPLDLARARMAVTHKEEYATLRHVFYKISREEGIAAFYKGYIPTVAGVVPYAGISFFTYDTLKLLYRGYVDDSSHPNPLITLAFGAVAGLLGQCSSYPLDIVRRRMQTDTQGQYTSLRTTVKIIYKEGIIGGFYKGLSMNWIKGPIAVGISYSTYDSIKNMLRRLTVKYNNSKFL